MANHPYNQHREQQVAHRRVASILKSSPSGAQQHNSGHAFSKITSQSAASSDDEVRGHSAPKRFARGGKVKGNGSTNIAIVLPGGGKGGLPGAPPIGAAAPPMPPPMSGGMPGLPPGGPPPGMPMRASGGRIGKMSGGAATGVGREEKAAKMKHK